MKKLLLLPISLLILVSCNKTEKASIPYLESDIPVSFQVNNLNTFTVKSVIPEFGDGQTVGIFAGAPINKSNISATIDIDDTDPENVKRTLVPASTIYWGVNQSDATDFIAMYPRDAREDFALTSGTTIEAFSINSEDNFSHPENFMRAAVTAAAYSPVSLNFTHPFVKVIFEITNSITDDNISGVSIDGFSQTGDLNLKTNTVSNLAAATTVTPYLQGTQDKVSTYVAITMPQNADPVVTVSMYSGANYVFKLASAFDFEAGKKVTAAITLTGGHSGSTTDRTPVEFGFTVADWVSASAGNMTQSSGGTTEKWWYIGGTIDNKNWESYQPMKAIAPYTWEGTIDYTPAVADQESGKGVKLRYYNGAADSEDWDLNFGTSETPSYTDGKATITVQRGGMDNNIKLGEAGTYKLTFQAYENDADKRLIIEKL